MTAMVRRHPRKSFPDDTYYSGQLLIGRAIAGSSWRFFFPIQISACSSEMDSRWWVSGPDKTFHVSLIAGYAWSDGTYKRTWLRTVGNDITKNPVLVEFYNKELGIGLRGFRN